MKRIFIYGVSLLLLLTLLMIFVYNQENWVLSSNKPEKQIVALGDSLTYGYGDRSGKGYVDNLQWLFNKHYKGKVTVHNLGIPGQQSDGLLQQIEKPLAHEEFDKADYFIVFIGTNDLIKSNGGDLITIHDRTLQIGKMDYQKNLEKILKIIRKKNPNAPILFLGLYNPYPFVNDIENVVREWNYTSKQTIRRFSNVHFISTNDIFKQKRKRMYFSDSLHPNKKGYDLITREILKEYNF